ncbi:hypothetical protein STSP2_01096 [Anaerohalosphaera lusitana]|uniref:Phage Tail Collar Domain protein n=1 Tax=Anaerohalosphaera lusitana TaxID=1936003 RepID=A0A1U9NJM8_9BACT|nr:phage tail protein [Anaerohalosphaera lusitana]AQT67944.1 hypothetical protein STSP2_01096 [Anaerohalosphaera lusitana]
MPHRGDVFAPGMIIMWSGLLSDVPRGWSVCDGSNGTPDLRNRFVRGASSVGGIGGSQSHVHCHGGCTAFEGGCPVYVEFGCTYPVPFYGHSHGASPITETFEDNLPPYYDLIFIRKD